MPPDVPTPAPSSETLLRENEALRRQNARLQRAVAELGLLNEVATALGTAPDVEAMLHEITQRALHAVRAEQGTVTLVDAPEPVPSETGAPDAALPGPDASRHAQTVVRTSVGTSARPAFRPGDVLLGWMHWYRKPLRLDDPHRDGRFHAGDWDPAVRSVLCVPMLVRGALVGVLTVYNKRGDAGPVSFSEEDTRLLAILAAQSAQIVENARVREEQGRIRRLFGQHLAPAVVDTLLRQGGDVQPRRQRVCVMFLDLRGFTAFAETAEPEAVMDRLNALFWFMIDEVNRHHGVIHQLLGDGFMALFGVPTPQENECQDAVHAALAIVKRLQAAVDADAVPPTRLGIGLHAGDVVAGLVGSQLHREYKVTGDVVNLAARIEGLNKVFDSTVLASKAVWDRVRDEVPDAEALGPVDVRGRQAPVALYRLA